MTAPVAHGYPDWGRYQAAADKVLMNVDVTDIDATTTYGPVFVGDVPVYGFTFTAQTNHFIVDFEAWDSQSLGVPLSVYSIELRAGDRCDLQVPVMGPWLLMRVTPSAANSQFEARLWTASIPFRPNAANRLGNVIFAKIGTVVVPGTTDFNASLVWPGEAELYMEFPATACDISLRAVDSAGTQTQLVRGVGANVVLTRKVYLPPMHLMTRVVNTAGVNQTVGWTLTASSGVV